MKVHRTLVPFALLALMVVAGVATAQVFVDTSEQVVELRPGKDAAFQVTITNPTDRPYYVAVDAYGNLSENVRMEPSRFPLPGNETRDVDVLLSVPKETQFEEGRLNFRFTVVDRQSGESIEQTTFVTMELDRPHKFMGLYENPLPKQFQSGWGLFSAEMALWAIIAFTLTGIIRYAVRALAPEANTLVQEHMAHMVEAPIWIFILVMGLNFSWRLLPPTPTIELFGRLLDASVVVVAAVLAYRASGAGLYYYGQNIAGRTETKVDDVLVPVLEKISAAVIIGMAAFYTFQVLGVDLSFLMAGGLVVGLVISMAAQDTLSNFFSGLYLLIDRPFREGDDIQLESGEITRVDDVGMRSSRLYHYRNHQQIIVPNNDLATKRVVNLTYPDKYYRIVIPVGVSYDSDLDEVRHVLHTVAMENEEVQKGRNTAPRVFVREFGDSSINLELRAYIPKADRRNQVRTQLMLSIHRAFADEGIEIPFPQRVLWHKQIREYAENGELEELLDPEPNAEPDGDGEGEVAATARAEQESD